MTHIVMLTVLLVVAVTLALSAHMCVTFDKKRHIDRKRLKEAIELCKSDLKPTTPNDLTFKEWANK